jgi:NADPH:quinone reductase-like Zn-dependent oxidoreductase
MIIRLGQHYGFRTINLVRRREQSEELLQAGGDAAICTNEESIEERVQALTNGKGVRFAVDAVGGATGSAVVRALGSGGRLLVYGTLSDEPLALDPRVLMVGQKSVEGFWLSEWVRKQRVWTMFGLLRRIGKLLDAGVLASEVGATFPLEQIQAAVQRVATPGRQGKVLLRIA